VGLADRDTRVGAQDHREVCVVVVTRELEVETLARHADRDPPAEARRHRDAEARALLLTAQESIEAARRLFGD
jgi:hypothetical protein